MQVQFTADTIRYINIAVSTVADNFYSVSFNVEHIDDSPVSTSDLIDYGLDLHTPALYKATFPNSNEIWVHFFAHGQLPRVCAGVENSLTGISPRDDEIEYVPDYFAILINGALEDVHYDYATGLEETGSWEVLLHITSGRTDGLIEISLRDTYYTEALFYGYVTAEELEEYYGTIDGIQTFTRSGNVNDGQPFNTIFFTTIKPSWVVWDDSQFNSYLGKIVVSNQPIDHNGDLIAATSEVNENFDVQLDIVRYVNFSADVQTDIIQTVNFNCDILRQIPNELVITPTENNVFVGHAETQGVQSIEIELVTQQLTDKITFTATGNFDIMQYIHGQYLDYKYSMRIEELRKKGVLTTYTCCSDIDEILYTQLGYYIPTEEREGGLYYWNKDASKIYMSEKAKGTALSHLAAIATALGKSLSAHISNFISTVDIEQSGVTYNDLIRDIFGWTSRIPTMLINCYIRDDTLYAVQRGQESNTVNLTGENYSVPQIRRYIVRTFWGATPTSNEVTTDNKTRKKLVWEMVLGNEIPEDDDAPKEEDEPKEISPPLVKHTIIEEDGVTIEIWYEYDEEDTLIKTTTETSAANAPASKTIVENTYETINGRKVLTKESTEEYVWSKDTKQSSEEGQPVTYGDFWELVSQKTINHTFLNQGQKHVAAVDDEGEIKGSQASPVKQNDKTTPYEKHVYYNDSGSFVETYGKEYAKYVKGYGWFFSSSSPYSHYTYVNGKKIEILGYISRYIEEPVKSPTVEGGIEGGIIVGRTATGGTIEGGVVIPDAEYTIIDGIELYDSSFPVDGKATLIYYTNALKTLNRKTCEQVSIDVYDYNHVIDFNDKVIFGGHTYYLEQNIVTKTPRIVNKQSLELVRWF